MVDTWSSADFDLLPKLKSVKIPTLVLYGDHDFIPASSAEHIAQSLASARMVTLKDCGHFSYMECPAAFRKQIDGFFRNK